MILPMDVSVLAILVTCCAVMLAVVAAVVIARGAEDRDLAGRLRRVVRPAEVGVGDGDPATASALARPFHRLGELLRNTALVSERDLAEFQRAVGAAGLNPRAVVPTVIGIKAVLLVGLPVLAFAYASIANLSAGSTALFVFGGLVLAVFGPNFILGMLRSSYQQQLRKGLPDALDLLVVTAEAGLGLETALDRVSREMEHTNRPIAMEFMILVQELRMLPDRRTALERFGERTNIEGFKRLGGTLSQTLRYGTPLAQALRVLAAEMRQDRMVRIEEKAIRLPALLVIPLILFIMPAVFIALVGPSVIELSKGFMAGMDQ